MEKGHTMKKRLLSALCAAVVACGIFTAPVQSALGSESAYAQAASAVSAPAASRKSGSITASGGVKVKLTCATKGAAIYYSANGGSYKRYTKALTLTKNTKLKVYAVKNGEKSAVRTYNYKLTPKVNITPAEGTYSAAQKITLSSPVSGVKFYYTLDGTKPTKSSTLYTANGITLSESATLRIMAVKSGWTSRYIIKDYEITKKVTAAPSDSIVDDYTKKYAYNTLSDRDKRAYERLYEAVAAHKASADISDLGISEATMERIYWAFDYDNGQFFWLANGCTWSYYTTDNIISVSPQYSRTAAQAAEIQPLFDAAADEIIAKALEKDDVFDRLAVIHDEIIQRTTYYSTGGVHIYEADGPLIYGKALCEGYSKAFMYLAQSIGVNCVCVAGDAGGAHLWNMVEVDGVWYHVDVTWDDPGSDDAKPKYSYFCISDSKMFEDHTVKTNAFPIPKATASGYDYYEHNGITLYTNVTDAYNALVKLCADNYALGIPDTTIVLESDALAEKLIAKMQDNYAFFDSLDALGCYASRWSSNLMDGEFTITLT